MMLRIAVVICSIAVVAAATHANVEHAGGYASESAPLAIAIASLLVVGMAFVGSLWQERRRLAASLLGLLLLCGEAYWLLSNAEREFAAREAHLAPLAKANAVKAAAKKAAEGRLQQATATKASADAAIVSEAAKPGCKANCAKLLSDVQI